MKRMIEYPDIILAQFCRKKCFNRTLFFLFVFFFVDNKKTYVLIAQQIG